MLFRRSRVELARLTHVKRGEHDGECESSETEAEVSIVSNETEKASIWTKKHMQTDESTVTVQPKDALTPIHDFHMEEECVCFPPLFKALLSIGLVSKRKNALA